MKIRCDFVTNSSSSSFIIDKDDLNQYQIEAIRNHSEIGELLGMHCSDECWNIDENDTHIAGHTSMDNFDMYEFLELFGVNARDVKWSEYRLNLIEE